MDKQDFINHSQLSQQCRTHQPIEITARYQPMFSRHRHCLHLKERFPDLCCGLLVFSPAVGSRFPISASGSQDFRLGPGKVTSQSNLPQNAQIDLKLVF
jgi:hypothetical protein